MSLFSKRSSNEAEPLSSEGRIPELDGATGWLNTSPLTPDDLHGSVALFQFCTYTCINWLRTLPFTRAWAEKYGDQGLVVVGVHTPEFEFEHDIDNARRSLQGMNVEYPIALDNNYGVWDAFANSYWPALYLVDQQGTIRYHHFGEGRYEESERAIQRLLGVDDDVVSVEGSGIEAAADWDDLESPETYVGYERSEQFASPGGQHLNESHSYTTPETLRRNDWAFEGDWTIKRQPAALNAADGRLTYRFHARDVNLVMAPGDEGTPVRFRVLIDGQAPGDSHGGDIDDQGTGVLSDPRLYQLIRQPGSIEDRTFEITFSDPGAQLYAFTFG
jgi:hypothetical protein